MQNSIVLGLGSNAAWKNMDSISVLKAASSRLFLLFDGKIKFSSVYRTKPMYFENQSDFLNMAAVCQKKDGMTARSLLYETQKIEAEFGRNREIEIRNGPRSLDIDIELFGNERVFEKDLTIPHERLFERAFVCVPVWEIAPEIALSKNLPKFENCADVQKICAPFIFC